MVLGFVESFLRQRGIGRLMAGLGVRQPAFCWFVCGMVYQHGSGERPIPGCYFLLAFVHLSNKLFSEAQKVFFLSLGLSASQN